MIITKKNLQIGKYKKKQDKMLSDFDRQDFVRRIWSKDPTVWKKESEYSELIKNRLGWLLLPVTMKDHCEEINNFTEEVRREGYVFAVVLGMGGSSMAPEVYRETFGVKENFLNLHILDGTDPVTVFDVENSIDINKTLFIVASKSGSTIEVDSFFRYFFEKVKAVSSEPGKHFIAITDPQTSLEALAKENSFRKAFINPPDIGGRYSALSLFGLVPAALSGVDIIKLLSRAESVMLECQNPKSEENPGVLLGSAAGLLAKKNMDKLTFVFPKPIASFGYWVEQLIAESTGKENTGILPVEGESTGKTSSYSNDRVFADFTLGKRKKEEKNIHKRLVKNFPVIELELKDKYDIASQFYLWEFATAVIGSVLGINPFDEPNVKESKDNTFRVLDYFSANKKLPERVPVVSENGMRIYTDLSLTVKKAGKKRNAENIFDKFLKTHRKGDYISLMAYLEMRDETIRELNKIREILRSRFKSAVTLGFGPRFLHSTGQYHKGGPNKGVFIQIVSDDSKDLEIPGRPYSFKVLMQSQAIGDYESLVKHKRRVMSFDIGNDVDEGLDKLFRLVKDI